MTNPLRTLSATALVAIIASVCLLRAEDPPAPAPPTIESLQKQVADLKAQVDALKAQLADMDALRQMWRNLAAKHAADAKSAAPAR